VNTLHIQLKLILAGFILGIRPGPHRTAVTHALHTEANDRVEFQIKEMRSADSMRFFDAEYSSGGAVARFVLTFRATPPTSGNMPVVKAALMARPGSDARGLLASLAQLHGGSLSRETPRRLRRLDITAAVLGQFLSHGPGSNTIAGEFSEQPRGDWLVLKLFLDTPDGATTTKIGEPAEIFVALNPVAGRGWFLVKDPEYWPELNRVLAAVL